MMITDPFLGVDSFDMGRTAQELARRQARIKALEARVAELDSNSRGSQDALSGLQHRVQQLEKELAEANCLRTNAESHANRLEQDLKSQTEVQATRDAAWADILKQERDHHSAQLAAQVAKAVQKAVPLESNPSQSRGAADIESVQSKLDALTALVQQMASVRPVGGGDNGRPDRCVTTNSVASSIRTQVATSPPTAEPQTKKIESAIGQKRPRGRAASTTTSDVNTPAVMPLVRRGRPSRVAPPPSPTLVNGAPTSISELPQQPPAAATTAAPSGDDDPEEELRAALFGPASGGATTARRPKTATTSKKPLAAASVKSGGASTSSVAEVRPKAPTASVPAAAALAGSMPVAAPSRVLFSPDHIAKEYLALSRDLGSDARQVVLLRQQVMTVAARYALASDVANAEAFIAGSLVRYLTEQPAVVYVAGSSATGLLSEHGARRTPPWVSQMSELSGGGVLTAFLSLTASRLKAIVASPVTIANGSAEMIAEVRTLARTWCDVAAHVSTPNSTRSSSHFSSMGAESRSSNLLTLLVDLLRIASQPEVHSAANGNTSWLECCFVAMATAASSAFGHRSLRSLDPSGSALLTHDAFAPSCTYAAIHVTAYAQYQRYAAPESTGHPDTTPTSGAAASPSTRHHRSLDEAWSELREAMTWPHAPVCAGKDVLTAIHAHWTGVRPFHVVDTVMAARLLRPTLTWSAVFPSVLFSKVSGRAGGASLSRAAVLVAFATSFLDQSVQFSHHREPNSGHGGGAVLTTVPSVDVVAIFKVAAQYFTSLEEPPTASAGSNGGRAPTAGIDEVMSTAIDCVFPVIVRLTRNHTDSSSASGGTTKDLVAQLRRLAGKNSAEWTKRGPLVQLAIQELHKVGDAAV